MASHDMKKAEATYGGFMTMLKIAVPVILVLTFFVLFLIAG